MDLGSFKAQFPALCDDARMRTLGAHEPADGARELDLTPEALESFTVPAPKDPGTLPAMLKQGPEAVAYYVSFRTDPAGIGIYVRPRGLHAPQVAYRQSLWGGLWAF